MTSEMQGDRLRQPRAIDSLLCKLQHGLGAIHGDDMRVLSEARNAHRDVRGSTAQSDDLPQMVRKFGVSQWSR